MKFITLLTATIFLGGCSVAQDIRYGGKSDTPIPTEELTAIGAHSTKGGSYEVAKEAADKFCFRWRAAPSIVRKQVKYQGNLQEDTQTAVTVASDVARAAGAYVPFIGGKDNYETTLTYKCY